MRQYPKYRAAKALQRAARELARVADAGGIDLSSDGPEGDQQMSLLSDNPEFPGGEQSSNPSDAQRLAPMMRHEGSAPPPHQFFWNGLSIVIENPKGSKREGTDPDGHHWEIEMKDHYGFIKNTEGADGEGVDVFVNPDAPEHFDNTVGRVFVVHQEVGGEYDEDKVMIGYADAEKAETAYRRNYDKDWDGLGDMTDMVEADFLNDYIKDHWKAKPRYKKTATMEHNVQAQINSLNDLSNNVGESGAPMNSIGPHSTQDDAHLGEDNTSEDVDLHIQGMETIGQVEAPYSDGDGPLATEFEEKDDEQKVVHAMQKLGKGEDPYVTGRLYRYNELLPQHQSDVKVNKALGSNRHDLLWLRTAMPLWQLIDESEFWYRKNFNHKWKQADRNKAIGLAELIEKGAAITPLMVSPPGEDNGGLWEGYHRLRAGELLMLDHMPVMMKIDPLDSVWQLRVADFPREPWVCVDFDGTIADTEHHGDDHNDAAPTDGVVEHLQHMLDSGWRVSIWTARQHPDADHPSWKEDIRAWCDRHSIPYTDIYEGVKPPADAFIDNLSVKYDGDWDKVFQETEELIKSHREAGILGIGDNLPDAYTNGDETRGDLSEDRGEDVEGLIDHQARKR